MLCFFSCLKNYRDALLQLCSLSQGSSPSPTANGAESKIACVQCVEIIMCSVFRYLCTKEGCTSSIMQREGRRERGGGGEGEGEEDLENKEETIRLEKSNILLLGPTGSGQCVCVCVYVVLCVLLCVCV